MNFSCFNNPKPDIFSPSKISKARPSIATVRGQILGTDSTKTLRGGGLDKLVYTFICSPRTPTIWEYLGCLGKIFFNFD